METSWLYGEVHCVGSVAVTESHADRTGKHEATLKLVIKVTERKSQIPFDLPDLTTISLLSVHWVFVSDAQKSFHYNSSFHGI